MSYSCPFVWLRDRKLFSFQGYGSCVAEDGESLEDVLKELFGEPISTYTDAEAVADGVLIPLLAGRKDTGHRITRSAFDTLSDYYSRHGYASYKADDFYRFFFAELLPLVGAARNVYASGGILTTTFEFQVVRQSDDKLWYLPNECGGVTMMLPSDY